MYVRQATQQAQNGLMLFNFIIELLTNTFKGQVLLYQSQYQVNNMYNGPALLRLILSLTYIDTRVTAMHLHNSLINMKDQLTKISGNMVEFNDWVRQQVSQLHSRGADATNLLAYLWNTYLTTPDKEFADYIKSLKNKYEDSQVHYTEEQLMILAEQKYKG